MSRLKGKVCVVNGVASTIGQAVAERFAVEGGVVASDDSGFITAAALPLDGGITEAFTVPE